MIAIRTRCVSKEKPTLGEQQMSKYENNAWAEVIYITLGIAFVLAIHLLIDEFFACLFFMFWRCFSSMIANIWRIQWKDLTEIEDRLSDKATAWTVYGMVIVVLIMLSLFAVLSGPANRREPLVVSWDVLAIAIAYSSLICVGVRFCVLIYLLRRERFPQKTRLLRGSSISDDFYFPTHFYRARKYRGKQIPNLQETIKTSIHSTCTLFVRLTPFLPCEPK